MKSKNSAYFYFIVFFVTVIFSNCITARIDFSDYNFSLKNTLSIFLLNNEKNYYFCMPVQYMGDYKIENFEFTGGHILIGDYEILLKRNEVNIYAYLNEATDDLEYSSGEFNLVYSEENGRILISKMDEPLLIKQDSDEKMNHYYFFIEKFLKNDEMKKIINEYKKGNVYSKLSIWYDITIDNELQPGNGMLDDFELSDELFVDNTWFFPNLNFFRAKYLQK